VARFSSGSRVGDASRSRSRTGLRDVLDVYENLRVESEEFIDAGDKVVVLGRTYASAKGSGLKLDLPVALVWTVQACKLARLDAFIERSDALAAAGLKE
jgi:ketosteroid isomerase-like protein